jgi:DNA adenine methylase
MKSPISWVGGKMSMASKLLPLFPEHKHYVEVFGGSLGLLFAKPPSLLETVNDLDEGLVNFWLMTRDRVGELIQKVSFTPFSRSLYMKWKSEPPPSDPVEWAARWFYIQNASFSANYGTGWSYAKIKGDCGSPAVIRDRRCIERLEGVCQRLAYVQVECKDFRKMISTYGNSEENFLYVDPPYAGMEWYTHNFESRDHIDLAEALNGCKARVMVSYYEHKELSGLYEGWNVHKFSKTSHANPASVGESKVTRVESVYTNYKVSTELTLF